MPGWGDFTDPLFLSALQSMLQAQQQESPIAQAINQNPQIQAIRAQGQVPLLTNLEAPPYGGGPVQTTAPYIASRPVSGSNFSVFGNPETPNTEVSPLPQQWQENYDRNQGVPEAQIQENRRNRLNTESYKQNSQNELTQKLTDQGYTAEDATLIAQGLMNPQQMSDAEKRKQQAIDLAHQRALELEKARAQAQVEQAFLQILSSAKGKPMIQTDDKGRPIYQKDADGHMVPQYVRDMAGNIEREPITPEEAANGLSLFRIGTSNGGDLAKLLAKLRDAQQPQPSPVAPPAKKQQQPSQTLNIAGVDVPNPQPTSLNDIIGGISNALKVSDKSKDAQVKAFISDVINKGKTPRQIVTNAYQYGGADFATKVAQALGGF